MISEPTQILRPALDMSGTDVQLPSGEEIQGLLAGGSHPPAALAWREGESTRVQPLREVTRIGRSLAAEIRFEDVSVSRRHAIINCDEDGRWWLADDRSLNGLSLNGARVQGRLPLRDGDVISIGRYEMLAVLDRHPSAPPRPALTNLSIPVG
jgi:pSer/pThr/pTyr-binding forkhead associated (FHA) protein